MTALAMHLVSRGMPDVPFWVTLKFTHFVSYRTTGPSSILNLKTTIAFPV